MSLEKLLLGFASAALVLTASNSGHAQVCASNADCRRGTTCQASAVAPAPSSRPACGKEVACGGAGPAPAEPGVPAPVEMFCQAASCTGDADCGEGMVCHAESSTTCSGGAAVAPCRPNTVCDQPAPVKETCTTTTHSQCAYKWQLPCNSDVDCGAAFTCVPLTSGTCSSGSGVGGGSSSTSTGAGGSASSGKSTPADLVAPGAPLPPADGGTTDPVCTTTSSFPGYCQAKATTCAVSADCPAAWTCADVSTPTPDAPATRGGTAGSSGGAVAPVPADAPPDAPITDAEQTQQTQKVCQAPASFPAGGVAATDSGGSGKAEPPTTTGGGATAGERDAAAGSAGCSLAAGASRGASVLGWGALGLAAALLFRRARRR